jgi:c-di-GMP-binding flagellar brake protein YcgR
MKPVSIKKIYANKDGSVSIFCDACGQTKRLEEVSPNYWGKVVRINCFCGHSFRVQFDRRRFFRKAANDLPGYYAVFGRHGEKRMRVVDVSLNGLCFKMEEPEDLETGDTIRVRFRLDDAHRTVIDRPVRVRYQNGEFVGVQFFEDDPNSRAFEMYFR